MKLNNLKGIRLERGLSQSTLSEISHVKLVNIQMYEQGKRDINKAQASIVFKLAKALNCTMEEIINKDSIL